MGEMAVGVCCQGTYPGPCQHLGKHERQPGTPPFACLCKQAAYAQLWRPQSVYRAHATGPWLPARYLRLAFCSQRWGAASASLCNGCTEHATVIHMPNITSSRRHVKERAQKRDCAGRAILFFPFLQPHRMTALQCWSPCPSTMSLIMEESRCSCACTMRCTRQRSNRCVRTSITGSTAPRPVISTARYRVHQPLLEHTRTCIPLGWALLVGRPHLAVIVQVLQCAPPVLG